MVSFKSITAVAVAVLAAVSAFATPIANAALATGGVSGVAAILVQATADIAPIVQQFRLFISFISASNAF